MRVQLHKKDTVRITVIASVVLLVIGAVITAMLLMRDQTAQAFTGGGTGTIQSPYTISTCAELQSIDTFADSENDWDLGNNATDNVVFKLINDIDCSASASWNGGQGFAPIRSFRGTLNGNGYRIDNLTIYRPDEAHVGLFRQIDSGALITYLAINGANITGGEQTGTLAGYAGNASIYGVRIDGDVTAGSSGGGFVGAIDAYDSNNQDFSLVASSYTGGVYLSEDSGQGNSGGVAGRAAGRIIISDVYIDGTIQSSVTGGIIGFLDRDDYGQNFNQTISHVITNTTLLRVPARAEASGGAIGKVTGNSTGNLIIDTAVLKTAYDNGFEQTGYVGGSFRNANAALSDIYYDSSYDGNCVGFTNVGDYALGCAPLGAAEPPEDSVYSSFNFTDVWSYNNSVISIGSTGYGEQWGPPTDLSLNVDDHWSLPTASWEEPGLPGEYDYLLPDLGYQLQYRVGDSTEWSTVVDSDTGSSYINDTSYSGDQFQFSVQNAEYEVRVRLVTLYGATDWITESYITGEYSMTEVSTCEELQAVNDNPYGAFTNIVLTQDIDCTGVDFEPLGQEFGDWTYSEFKGNIEGQGHKIINLTINQPDREDIGLIQETNGANVRNLTFEGGSVIGESSVGILAGEFEDGGIDNVHSSAVVTATDGSRAGGIVGSVLVDTEGININIGNVSSTGDVAGYEENGGVIGRLVCEQRSGSIQLAKVWATGDVGFVDQLEGEDNGGLVGSVYSEMYGDEGDPSSNCVVRIEDSYARGNVYADEGAGGLIGSVGLFSNYSQHVASLIIFSSYATGNVFTNYDAGGFIGTINGLSNEYSGAQLHVENSFAAGTATAQEGSSGGFIGYFEQEAYENSTVINNYYDSSSNDFCAHDGETILTPQSCQGIDEDAQPLYFRNNSTNAPLTTWDFGEKWMLHGGYPVFYGTPAEELPEEEPPTPSGDDANGDDIADTTQPYVATYINPVTSTYAVLEVDEACTIEALTGTSAADAGLNDAAYSYVTGLMNFTIDCGTPGFSTQVTQYFYGVNPAGLTARKFNSNTNASFSIGGAVIATRTIDGQSVATATYTVTDGGVLDIDGVEDGVIIDPAGLARLTIGAPNTGVGGVRQFATLPRI